MFKNVAAKFMVYAFDATTGLPKTGDAANITAYVSKDYGTVTVLADTSATEMDATNARGYYLFDAAQGETNGDILMVSGKSSTSNIVVIGAPAIIYTRPPTGWLAPATAGRTLVVDSSGLADANMVKAGPSGSGTAQTAKDIGAAVPAAAAGASGGLLISGSNAGTTTLGALTITGVTTLTGNVALADGLTIAAPSTGNRAGLDITGNGTGAAIKLAAGATGKGIAITTTAGDGLSILPTAGHAIVATANGTSKHGIVATGGTAGTSDGIKAVAGTGGVDLRAAITGDITGALSGAVGSVTGAVGSVTGAVGSVTGSVGSVTGLTASDVGAIKAKTDNLPSDPADESLIIAATNALASSIAAIPTAAANADAVWDEALSGHAGVGSAGEALTASGAAGDPWIADLSGYSAGQAGYVVANLPDATENADALLNRDMSAVSDTNSRSPLNALRFVRNGFNIDVTGTLMTVLKEDDTTAAYTRDITSDPDAAPITGVS